MDGEDFRNSWSLMPGTTDPETAEADTTNFADGSIIAKVNIEDDETTVNAYTVMKKMDGFAPSHADWFWIKYDPQGEIMTNPDGVPMAGALGADGLGCISCHEAEPDYVFKN